MPRKRVSKASVNYPKYPGLSVDDINKKRRTKIRRDKFMEVGEVRALLDAIRQSHVSTKRRDYMLIYTAFNLGLRAAEVVALNVEESLERIDESVVMVRTAKRRDHKTDTEGLPIRAKVRDKLLKYSEGLEARGGITWLFPSKISGSGHVTVRLAQKIFDRYVRLAKLPVRLSFHSLRHSFGVMVQRKYKDIVVTKALMRHKTASSTHIYVELAADEKAKAIDGLPAVG